MVALERDFTILIQLSCAILLLTILHLRVVGGADSRECTCTENARISILIIGDTFLASPGVISSVFHPNFLICNYLYIVVNQGSYRRNCHTDSTGIFSCALQRKLRCNKVVIKMAEWQNLTICPTHSHTMTRDNILHTTSTGKWSSLRLLSLQLLIRQWHDT